MKHFYLAVIPILFFSFTVPAQLNQWVQMNEIGVITSDTISTPTSREAACLNLNGKLYVFGSNTYTGLAASVMTWEFNPANENWIRKKDYPGEGKNFVSGFSLGNYLYVGFGIDTNYTSSDFHRYDPLTDTWTKMADLPVEVQNPACFSIGTKG